MEPVDDVTIAFGTNEDLEYLIDLGRRTAVTSLSEQRPAKPEVVQMMYLKMLDFVFTKNPTVFLAKEQDTSLGFLIYADFLPDDVTGWAQGFVVYMAVEPHARNRGVAKKLLTAAEEFARSQGIETMALMVTENNYGARSVYGELGYTTERRLLCKNL